MPRSRRVLGTVAVSMFGVFGTALVAGGCGGRSSGGGAVSGAIEQPTGGTATDPTPPGSGSGSGSDSGSGTGFGSNWTVYHQDGLGHGVDPAKTNLRPLSHAWTSPALDGQLYGEPLVFDGRVVVATENDTVYELAANTGNVIWSRHLASPVPDGPLPCGNIGPTVGITDTPVIDAARKELFVEADQLTGSSGASHHLWGLNVITGATELNQVVDPPGSHPLDQLQRSALALDAGQVLVSFGGNYGDCGFYHGWEVAVPEAGGKLRTFEVDHVGNDTEGAIWMGGAAPVVDSQGNVWVTAGNGSARSAPYDYSDSVLELSSTLALKQYFAPASWGSDNANDLDLGSDQVALVGNQVFIAGKSDHGYLLDLAKLGGIGHQEQAMAVCGGDPDGGIASSGSTVYVPCGGGLEALQIRQSPPGMKVLWQTSTGSSGPAIVASGLVWTIDQGGEFYGLSPSTGDAVIRVSIGSVANHFSTPTVADGLLLAPATNHVYAFKGPAGLPPPPSGDPTTHAVGAAVTSSNWTVYHDNGLGTGVDPAGTKLLPLSSAWRSPVLDGELYGEPLVYNGRILVATENDTVYELAANTGKVIWSHHLASPVPDSDLPCGDVHPTVGITGTPVIDPARNEIFVVTDELTGGNGASHHLWGLNLKTGAKVLDQMVDPAGSTPVAQLQRPGLAIAGGHVLVGFGGNAGDCGAYHGWLVSVPEVGGTLQTFEVDRASGDRQGAIWMGGAAPVVDARFGAFEQSAVVELRRQRRRARTLPEAGPAPVLRSGDVAVRQCR